MTTESDSKQQRWRSWPLWTAIGALVVYCVKTVTGLDIGPTIDGFLNVLLPVLVLFGVVNNPTDSQHW